MTDHLYFNLNYFNNSNDISSTQQYIPAEVVQTYDRNLIEDCSTWNVAIARFSISSNYVGRVYQVYPTTISNSNLIVGLKYNNINYDVPIVLPIVKQQDGNFQQLVYNVNDFIDLINNAYTSAQALVTTAGGPTGIGSSLITYDVSTGLYCMNVPTYYSTTGTIQVTMSYQLFHKFQGFSATINNPILYNGHDVTFKIESRGDNIITIQNPLGVTGLYYAMRQDAHWSSSITDINRLIITTNTIPIVQEYKAQQLYTQFSGNNANQSIQALTSFLIGQDQEIIARAEHWIYIPNFLRLVSLKGGPVRTLHIKVYIGDVFGNIFPLYLGPLDSIDMSLIFLKKGLES